MFRMSFASIIRRDQIGYVEVGSCPIYGHYLTDFYLLRHRDTRLVPVVVTTVLRTPDDGCKRHPKHVEGYCSKIKQRLLMFASRWSFII
jgi:hypothetical protein